MSSDEKDLFDEGCMLYDQQEYIDALAKFKAVLLLNPGNTSASYQLARVLIELDRSGEVLQILREITRGFLGRENDLYDLGMALYGEGHYQTAAKVLLDALALSSGTEHPLDRYVESLSDVAWELDRSDALDEAISVYENILAYDSSTPDIFARLSISYTRKLRVQDASEAIAKAKHLEAKNVMTYIAIGYLMARLNRYGESETNYQEALLLDADNVMAIVGKSSALIKQGKHQAAGELLESAMEKHPGNSQIYDELGFVHAVQENYGEAQEFFRRSLQIDPNDTRAISGIAKVLSDQNKDDQASLYYQKLLELCPDDPTALEGLAIAEMRRKNFSNAIPYLQRAVASDPFRPLLYVYLVTSQFHAREFISIVRSLILMQHNFSTKAKILRSPISQSEY